MISQKIQCAPNHDGIGALAFGVQLSPDRYRIYCQILPAPMSDVRGSGESWLRHAEQLIGIVSRSQQPIIVGAQTRDLELESAYFCAQYGDLVDEAPI
jgi:hypothetical protein